LGKALAGAGSGEASSPPALGRWRRWLTLAKEWRGLVSLRRYSSYGVAEDIKVETVWRGSGIHEGGAEAFAATGRGVHYNRTVAFAVSHGWEARWRAEKDAEMARGSGGAYLHGGGVASPWLVP
jgi:hypothetical protein